MRTQLKLISNKCLFLLRPILINNYNLCHNKHILCSISLRSFTLRSNRHQKAKAVAERRTNDQTELTVGQKVKQTTQDVSYFGSYPVFDTTRGTKLLILISLRRYISWRYGHCSHTLCCVSGALRVRQSERHIFQSSKALQIRSASG